MAATVICPEWFSFCLVLFAEPTFALRCVHVPEGSSLVGAVSHSAPQPLHRSLQRHLEDSVSSRGGHVSSRVSWHSIWHFPVALARRHCLFFLDSCLCAGCHMAAVLARWESCSEECSTWREQSQGLRPWPHSRRPGSLKVGVFHSRAGYLRGGYILCFV